MTQPSNTHAIEVATGRKWTDWVEMIDAWDGRKLTHPEIAALAQRELEGSVDNSGWWGQSIAVAYEQHIGRRQPGQRNDGLYEFSVSKTFALSKDETYARLLDRVEGSNGFDGMAVLSARKSVTPVRSYWKCNFPDGAKLTCAVEDRANGKSAVVVTVSQLNTTEQRDHWRAYWRNFLTGL